MDVCGFSGIDGQQLAGDDPSQNNNYAFIYLMIISAIHDKKYML